MVSSNFQNQAMDNSIDTEPLYKLLEKIHAPQHSVGLLNVVGLSYAIKELLDATKAVLRLAPSSAELLNLISVLEFGLKLELPDHGSDLDSNPMRQHYKEYPLYSLFTQGKKWGEGEEDTAKFHMVMGLLLAAIWVSEPPWNPLENGYAEFVTELRIIRNKNRWHMLKSINPATESIQSLIDSLSSSSQSSEFIFKIRQLAIKVGNTLGNNEFHQLESKRRKTEHSRENYGAVSQPNPKLSDDKQPEQRQPKRREPDLGENDEWRVGKQKRTRPVVTQRPPALLAGEIVLRKPATHQRGIDNAETGVTASIVIAPSTINVGELPALPLQQFQVLDARFATEFDNQFLPYSWEVLNELEVRSIVVAIKTILKNKAETTGAKIGALVAGLSVVTSRTPEELAAFRFFPSRTSSPLAGPAILMGNACWYSSFPPLERFEPNNRQAHWLKAVGDGCYLPLPTEILSALSELSINGETLSEALGCSAEELNALTEDFCRDIRRDAKSRANVSWLRSIMFFRLLALSGDDVGSVATLGNTEHAPNVGLYYATFKQQNWRVIYSDAISALALSPSVVDVSNSLPFGSRQYPDETKLSEWITEFSHLALSRCKNVKSTYEIIDAHNHLAGYTFLMLLASTGHRPAEIFTFSMQSIDLNNGWIIISDKITSASTRVRLVPLPTLVVKQLNNYIAHLRNLVKRIQIEHPELANAISQLVEAPSHPRIPFLFWLDEDLCTSAIDIPTIKKKFNWPFEGNVFRHCLATGLRDQGALAEYIAILLGHVGVGQFGFGKFSALSPALWKKNISAALNSLLESQGWINVGGITHPRWLSTVYKPKKCDLEKIPRLDCFRKVRDHIGESKSDRQTVRAAFKAAKEATASDSNKVEFLTEFRNEIIKRSIDTPDRLAKRLNIHVRFIRLHRHALNPNSIPGWAADMHSEDNPLEPESLMMADCAAHYRTAIPVVSQKFMTMSISERIALILISSVLFGGLLRKSLVEKIPALLDRGVRWYEPFLWIDFDDPQSGGCQRWFFDPITALLVAQFIKSEPGQIAHGNHLRHAICKLLNKIGPTQQQYNFKINSLDDLIIISKSYFALHLPGLMRAYAFGDVRSASLTEGGWLRLLSGRPLVGQSKEQTIEHGSMQPLRHTSQDVKSARSDVKEIFDAIRDAFPASNIGATNLKGTRRNPLTRLSTSLEQIALSKQGMPSIVLAILSWTNHLATEGSVVVRNPAIGTIYSYVTDISKPLIEFCSEVDFVELTEAELTDVYQRVINCGSKNTRASRAKSLRWFHEFCEEEFDIPELDWGDVAPGLTNDKSNVSANLVTFSEYGIAKSLIKNHPHLNLRDRQLNEVALILIYRCGLRLGELMRLTVSDLILQEKSVLLVRNGIYGKTKSRAGIRQVPWLGRLDEYEKTLVEGWVNHRKSIANGDPWAAIFGIAEESRTLEVRLRLSRILVEVLRFVTGDPTVKIHHLRHGAGTSALSIALSIGCSGKVADSTFGWFNYKSDAMQNIASEFCEFHLGLSAQTRRIIYAISQVLGHSSPRTTSWHYGHLLDFSLYEHVTSLISLKNIEVAQLSGMTQNAIGVALFKNLRKAPASLALSWLLKNTQGLEPSTKLADQPVAMDTVLSQAPIHPLSSLKLAHVILTDLSSGFPVAKIAGRYVRDEIEIQAIQSAAIKIEKRTGYCKLSLVKPVKENVDNFLANEQKSKMKKLITGHAIGLIKTFQNALENPKFERIMKEGLDVWLDRYQRAHSGLRIPYKEELKIFIELLELLGFHKKQIVLVGSIADNYSKVQGDSRFEISDENFILRSENYRSIRRTPTETTYAPALFVSINSNMLKDSARSSQGGASIPMQKLHHLLFLSSVIQKFRNELEGQKIL